MAELMGLDNCLAFIFTQTSWQDVMVPDSVPFLLSQEKQAPASISSRLDWDSTSDQQELL